MSIVVVGSVAFDSVRTPYGEVEDALGGAATYFSVAASYFSPVRVVAVVGEDFSEEHMSVFQRRGIDCSGIERASGRTFRWGGEYSWNLNERQTLFTELNVFENFAPKLPKAYIESPYLFLANIDPELQLSVLEQMEGSRLVACDTMNYWIEGQPEALRKLLRRVDVLVINDDEARELSGTFNLVQAAHAIRTMGPAALVIKRGEHGVLAFLGDEVFTAPGFPLEKLADPTGAGDTFAGGFLGYLAQNGDYGPAALRRGIVAGSVMASFCVESFSLDGILALDEAAIQQRYRAFQLLTEFGDL
ncbi:MAG: PfkB family carbohydrate kinase [Acidobacteriota bacterium]